MNRDAGKKDREPPWWVTAFAGDYQAVYAHRDDRSAAEEVAALATRLRGIPGPILDLGCGAGRHVAALRALGLPAFGLDYSACLLHAAAARDTCRGRLVRGDMRHLPVAGGWGAVLLLFSVFGYFNDDDNAHAFGQIAALLRPGGWLVLDIADPARLAHTLQPSSERVSADGRRIREWRRLDGQHVEKEIEITSADGQQSQRYRERVRLYRPDEIAAHAAVSGLAVRERWSSLRGPQHDDGRAVYWLSR